MLNEVRWGIIGCGDVTEKKSGPAFNKVPGSSLAAVMRRDAAKAEDYARRHGVPLWFADADALIHSPEVNAVYIATPPGSHCELALKAAAAGKPCYVEKPMARNAEECRLMVETFEKAQLPLFTAYYRRSFPHFNYVKDLIAGKSLGNLRELHYRFSNGWQRNPDALNAWRYQPETSGGGLLWDMGSHALDLFDYWLGPLENVEGRMKNLSGRGKVEEWASARFEAGGAVGTATWNFMSINDQDTIELVFDRGVVYCSCFGPPNVHQLEENNPSKHTFELPENVQFLLISLIVASLRTGSSCPSTGATGLRTNRVLDQIAGN
jgi:1,5-anhydro-D-fructose reductase (1,5-anhydro-D-mannitol-forming)